ncbi:hypothetical protein AMELA_G00171250 [Ameiurus melas]|uniref:Uncharacterized protein n=1 Tax=Ameiurus melas TaxID=219545 RepID=A0A7J6AEI3_AMEME|nr:hypothetical protein AMELA_G00171250 [Ameiurus melas]
MLQNRPFVMHLFKSLVTGNLEPIPGSIGHEAGSRSALWCREAPLFDHRTMHKDGVNDICSQPSLGLFGPDKLVCLKMFLQSDLSLLPTHTSVLSSHKLHMPHSD